MNLIYLIFAFSAHIVNAGTPQHWIPNPPNGTLYLDQSKCPGECMPLVKNGVLLQPDVVKKVGNEWVEDPVLKAEKEAKAVESEAKKELKRIKREESLVSGIKGAKNFQELKQALIDYLEIE